MSLTERIEEHQGLVGMMVKRYMWSGIERKELHSLGLKGLMRANEDFDPERGVKFSSYAIWWIRAEMSNAVRRHMHVRIHEVAILDRPQRKGKNSEVTMKELIVADNEDPCDMIHNGAVKARLQEMLKALPEREAFVIFERIWREQTLQAIGDRIGVSRERVRQIEQMAYDKLRKAAASHTELLELSA